MDASDVATEAFLETAAEDLGRQLARSGWIDTMKAQRAADGGVQLFAVVVVAEERVELHGSGQSLVDAYADLIRNVPEPVLASAYRQVVDPRG